MSDISERATVYERRSSLKRLNEVRQYGILQQNRHRSGRLEVVRRYRPAPLSSATKTFASLLCRSSRSFARHSKAMISEAALCRTRLPGDPIGLAANADHNIAQ